MKFGRLAGMPIELPAPGRLGVVFAPQQACNVLGAAVSIECGMRCAECGMECENGNGEAGGGRQRLEEKRQKPPRSFEEPSKNHRRSIEDTS